MRVLMTPFVPALFPTPATRWLLFHKNNNIIRHQFVQSTGLRYHPRVETLPDYFAFSCSLRILPVGIYAYMNGLFDGSMFN